MPKKKKQDKAKPAKAKLPKQIAGIKIGKELRNAVEPVLRFAGHPMVSDALAAALIAGADTLIGKGGDGAGAAEGSAASGSKKRSPVGLMIAVAAGEIAAQIVSAYQGVPESEGGKNPTKKRRASARGQSSGRADRRK